MTAAILKRKEWGKKYNLPDFRLFELFSEFSAMMMIGKADDLKEKDIEAKKQKML